MRNEFLYCQTDVAGDAAKQHWRQVASAMYRYSRSSSVTVTESLVRTTLSNFLESECLEHGYDFPRLEDRNRRHPLSGHHHDLSANELACQRGCALVKDHGNDFLQVVIEFL